MKVSKLLTTIRLRANWHFMDEINLLNHCNPEPSWQISKLKVGGFLLTWRAVKPELCCRRHSGGQDYCAMEIWIIQLGSVSIRLPCCQCDKCAACRGWKTLQTSHSLPVPGSVSVCCFLTGSEEVGLQLLRSLACQILMQLLSKSSPHVHVSIGVCFALEVCGVVSVCRWCFLHCKHLCTPAHVRLMPKPVTLL